MAFSSEQNNNNFTARAANAQWEKYFKAVCCFWSPNDTFERVTGRQELHKSSFEGYLLNCAVGQVRQSRAAVEHNISL